MVGQNSSLLSIDLLDYEYLNQLWNQKFKNKFDLTNSFVSTSENKKYFIVTYITDFDKINYPIPLKYIGCKSIKIYRDLMHELRKEISLTKNCEVGISCF